jgi:hypothetical protein
LQQEAGKNIRVFVVWEPVLATDWQAPSSAALSRISDKRVRQYWDSGRLLSKAMGETGRKSVVWDQVIVYERGVIWSEAAPPRAVVRVGPVVKVVGQFVEGLHQALGTSTAGATR